MDFSHFLLNQKVKTKGIFINIEYKDIRHLIKYKNEHLFVTGYLLLDICIYLKNYLINIPKYPTNVLQGK